MAGLNAWLTEEEDAAEPVAESVRVALPDPPDQARRVAVYVGRCIRCHGAMMHGAREYGDGMIDDAVYRCLSCGWRTSPGYEENRKFGARIW